MRLELNVKTNQVAEDTKMMLVELIYQHEDPSQNHQSDVTSVGPDESSTSNEYDRSDPNQSETNQSSKRLKLKNGHMSVNMVVKDAAPQNDKPVSEIENDLFSHASTQTNAHDFMDMVTRVHPELHGEDIEKDSPNFVVRCDSSDAADALWNAYSSGRLDRMADKAFLSIPLLDDIGARMLSLETFIDYQEYVQCKQDIKDKEAATEAPNVTSLTQETETLDGEVEQTLISVNTKEQHIMQKKVSRDSLHLTCIKESEAFNATWSRMFNDGSICRPDQDLSVQ
ncbi:uncharacterized protein [Ptychodera flava]|uniref:uncharacterized protein isoform X2 n=1 Tax=Ptychodera flava TaxID=63121 RepID=UPI003969D03E